MGIEQITAALLLTRMISGKRMFKMQKSSSIGNSLSLTLYKGYPESKFRWAIKKKTIIHYKPCILPFDVHIVHYFST